MGRDITAGVGEDGDVRGELVSIADDNLKGTISDLKKSQRQLAKIDDQLKSRLGLNEDRSLITSYAARVLNFIMPKSLQEHLPNWMAKFIAEEFDALEQLEGLMKGNINNTQSALKKLAVVAIKKQKDLEGLEESLGKAERESWDAQRLQDFMANRAGFAVDAEIKTLLDKKFRGMSDEQKELRRQTMLQQIRAHIMLGKELVQTMEKVCSAGLEVYQEGLSQYGAYMGVYKQVATVRDASKTLVSMNGSMYTARDALAATFKVSLHAVALAVDAAQHVERYAIASPEMHDLFIAGQEHLEQKLLALDNQRVTMRKALEDKSQEGRSGGGQYN